MIASLVLFLQKYETREMHNFELVQCDPDRVLFWRCGLNFLNASVERLEVFG